MRINHWERLLVSINSTIIDAISSIERSGTKIAIIVSEDRRLVGTLTDGDARRALLNGVCLNSSVQEAMNGSPLKGRESEPSNTLLELAHKSDVRVLPIVDEMNTVVGAIDLQKYYGGLVRDNLVVVMAGGYGRRLGDLTRDKPKPMLNVGSRPILETILLRLVDQGFRRIYISVNYKSEQIEDYFGDGGRFNADIRYLREKEPLGTAGSLSLLPDIPESPTLVTNADLLTDLDFATMVEKHTASGADATMGIRNYEITVPYGIVHQINDTIQSIQEKPKLEYSVNAGIYVLGKKLLSLLVPSRYVDMTEVFSSALKNGFDIRSYQIHGYWLDIGRIPDLERARAEYVGVFE